MKAATDKFKEGDFIVVDDGGETCIAIFKSIENDSYVNTYIDSVYMLRCCFSPTCNLRYATEEEKQCLLGKMHSKGKDWDSKNKKIIPYIYKDWEQRRYEIAKGMLMSIESNSDPRMFSGDVKEQVKWAIEFADELIKQLRKDVK